MSGEARFLRGQLVRSNHKWARGADGRWQTRADAKPGAPDYFGTAELSIPGADPALKVRLSGWVRKSKKSGEPYLSLEAEWAQGEERRPSVQAGASVATVAGSDPVEGDVDDLPF